jgi:hypothetical protein
MSRPRVCFGAVWMPRGEYWRENLMLDLDFPDA